jgi:filamentous hemagglutinin
MRESMRQNEWKGDPIDVVDTPDGLVTVDHTRAAVARELGISQIPVRVHAPNDPLPADMVNRPWNSRRQTATTWGEAVALRGAGQKPPLGPTGTPTPPRLMYDDR